MKAKKFKMESQLIYKFFFLKIFPRNIEKCVVFLGHG